MGLYNKNLQRKMVMVDNGREQDHITGISTVLSLHAAPAAQNHATTSRPFQKQTSPKRILQTRTHGKGPMINPSS